MICLLHVCTCVHPEYRVFSRNQAHVWFLKIAFVLLISKEHIAMHTNLILLFKPALYSSILVIKCFKSSLKLF